MRETIARCTREVRSLDFDYRIVRKDGAVRVLHSRGDVVAGADGAAVRYVGTAQDITERKAAEGRLREANQLLSAVIDASPLAIIMLDDEDRVCSWSAAAERMFGWTSAEVVGQRLPIIPPEREGEIMRLHNVAPGDWRGVIGLETQRIRKDGSRIDVSVSTARSRMATG